MHGTKLERRNGRRRPHGRNFHALLLEACMEYWPEIRSMEGRILREWYPAGGGATAAYSMDRAIERALRAAHPAHVAASAP
jgi:hypothetical protein